MSQGNKLFGSSGIRGDANEFFTNQLAFDLGRTFSIFLANHDSQGWVAVGMDPRESSPRIKRPFILGLLHQKREVFDEGVCPIPAMNWILKVEPKFSGSVMISGSHVKPHLNGLKFFAFGEEILKNHEQEIENIYWAEKEKVFFNDKSDYHINQEQRASEAYIEYVLSKVKFSNQKMKVVVDAGNGAQSEVAPAILKRLGFDVVEVNTNIQEQFMSRDTEVSGDFDDLTNQVLKAKADLGIGYDSDGDRVVFVDEKGNFIPGDYSGSLIGLACESQVLVTPINTSQIVETLGKEVHRTRVGSPFVVAKMKETNAGFGFEANGGGVFSDMYSRDGGRSTIEFLNILIQRKLKPSELVATLAKYYILRDKIEYQWELKEKIILEAKEHFKGIKVDETDGLKIWVDSKSWILFRSSANAPEFRVFVESDNQDRAQELLETGFDLVKNIVKMGK